MDEATTMKILETIESKDIAKARSLLKKHPEQIPLDYGLGTWVHMAAPGSSAAMVKMLLELGIPVDAELQDVPHQTALELVISKEDCLETVKVLLENGADPNHGRTILGAIAGNRKGSLEKVKLLESYGVDLHQVFVNHQTKNKDPMNALSTAVLWEKEDVAEYLRSRGCVMPTPAPSKPSLSNHNKSVNKSKAAASNSKASKPARSPTAKR